MSKTHEQRQARALQSRTGWSYSECLRCVRTMMPEQVGELIRDRSLTRDKPGS